MSYECVRRVMAHSRLKAPSRMVLLVIAEHAKRDGSNSFCSQATIAREAGMKVRQVRNQLDKLTASGELGITPREGTTPMYQVKIDPDESCRGDCCKWAHTHEQKLPGSPAESVETLTKVAAHPGSTLPMNRTRSVPEPSLEPSPMNRPPTPASRGSGPFGTKGNGGTNFERKGRERTPTQEAEHAAALARVRAL